MRRLSAILLFCLLVPVPAALAQADAGDARAESGSAVLQAQPQTAETSDDDSAVTVPPVRRSGSSAALGIGLVPASGSGVGIVNLGNGRTSSMDITFGMPARTYSGVRVSGMSEQVHTPRGCEGVLSDCIRSRQVWRGGSLLGGFRGDGLLLGVGVDWMQHNPETEDVTLVLPATGQINLMGIPAQWVDSISRIEATGRLDLGEGGTYLDMGASVGRVRLLPEHAMASRAASVFTGYDMATDSIDQKTLSVGLGRGAVSGALVGRLMRPEGPDALSGATRQAWSAVDLGITVRLPWEGELKLGAQNLWSSGDKAGVPGLERDPVQGRIPYIRYHQNL